LGGGRGRLRKRENDEVHFTTRGKGGMRPVKKFDGKSFSIFRKGEKLSESQCGCQWIGLKFYGKIWEKS
jgi:hypothetical protein